MGLFFGLLAALGWGVGDYLSRQASQAAGYYRVLLYIQLMSTVLLAGWLALAPGLGVPVAAPHPTVGAVALAVALAGLNIAGSLLLLRAFAIGILAVVAPIGAAFAAVSVVLSLLWGDPITPLHLGGLGAALLGVILSSTPGAPDAEAVSAGAAIALPEAASLAGAPARHLLGRMRAAVGVGVPEALGAAVTLGAFFWAQRFVLPDLGPHWAATVVPLATGLLLLPLAAPLRQPWRPPPPGVLRRVAAIACGYSLGGVAFNVGIGFDSPGVVAVVGSLASPLTVLLAFVLLRERLTRLQWAGVGLIFIALALIAWPE